MLRFICALLVLAVAVNAGPPRIKYSDSFMNVKQMRHKFGGGIVGGEEVEANSIPFQISFKKRGFHYCGGSIISEDTVITAAHCCEEKNPKDVSVVAGEHDLFSDSGDEQKVAVEKITYHELFGSHGTNFDVCLLKLNAPLKLNDKVKAVALPEKDQEFTGEVVTSGWGAISSSGYPKSPVLLAVTVDVVTDEDCKKVYGSSIDDTMICAASPGKDSCQGDSGGPLAQDGVLVGIVSWGYGCSAPGYPGVYAKVAKFIDWIAKNA